MKPIDLIDALLLKNRTIVSKDNEVCIDRLSEEIPLTVHRYPTGNEYSTWVVPEEWNVIKAELSDGVNVIASYEDHPLFLAPYSHSFTGWISREELLSHVRSDPERPDTFLYEYRLAYDYRRRLKEWAIALPYSTVRRLDKPRYFVDIQVETKPGNMLVAESTIKGSNDYTFAFLTHLCHPGQANDGLADVAVGVEVMRRLREEFSRTNYNYQLLVNPETIGSVVYLTSNEDRIDHYLGSIFIEMPGLKSPLRLGLTRRANTYLDRVLRQVVTDRGVDFSETPFTDHWGNDELIFDSSGIGIPGASIERYPHHYYHTSGDNLEQTDEAALDEVVEILVDLVHVIESDFIPVPKQKVAVYLTRYDLYADWENERSQHDLNNAILRLLWDGISAFDIAHNLGVSYDPVQKYLMKFVENDLLGKMPITPAYFRGGGVERVGEEHGVVR